jgi:succinoglycan biosynthesis transport protein ExoP
MSEQLLPAVRRQNGNAVAGGMQDVSPRATEQHPFDRPLAVVRRYKWLIAAVVLLASAGGVAATRLITPQYEVRATIWVESNAQSANRTGPIRSSELLTSTGWIELFRSYRIVDEVVRKLALYLRPARAGDAPLFAGFTLSNRFLPGAYELEVDPVARRWELRSATGTVVDRGTASDSVGRRVGFHWILPEPAFRAREAKTIPFAVATPRETSVELLNRLNTRLMPGSNFLWLSHQNADRHLAARTLNVWVAEFLHVAAELKKRNMVEFARILEGQLQYAEKSTQDAEAAYQRFRVNTITLPTDAGPVAAGVNETRDPALSSFFDQKIQYDNLRSDREALEKAIAHASTGAVPFEGLLFIPSVAQSPGAEALREAFRKQYAMEEQLRVYRQSFTDEHPNVKEVLANIETFQKRTIPQLANRLLLQIKEREFDYQRRIEGASRELQQIPPRTIEEIRLQRAVAVASGLYTNLKNRYAEAKLAEASAVPDVNVLDTAIAPVSPTKNTAPMVMLLSVMGGLGLAIGLAFLLDMLDRRIRYPDQASHDLGLIIAGAVPRIPKQGINVGSPEQVLQFVEAFRTLRMHVVSSLPGERISVAVSSPAPADGKSLVSSNLALSFAEAGFKTVLVDGDTRRGALHQLFGLSAPGGLTEYLAETIDLSGLVRATRHQNLSLVTCGKRNPRSPELLGSPRLKVLVDYLSHVFDVVIVDTPPLAAGIDAYALSAATGRMLMVLRMGQTERRLASAKLSVADRLPIDIIGAVLNGVQLTGEFQYYAYSSGYSITADGKNKKLEVASAN